MSDIHPEVNNWKDKLALIISGALSPFLLTPFFLYIVCRAFSHSTGELFLYFGTALLFSAVIPFGYIYIMVKMKKISDVHVAKLEERKGPFTVGVLSIIAGTGVLYLLHAPREILVLGVVIFFTGILFFLITLYWKISMHASVVAVFIVSLAMLVNMNYAYGLLVIPPIIWARTHRGRHTLVQGITALTMAVLVVTLLLAAFGYPKH